MIAPWLKYVVVGLWFSTIAMEAVRHGEAKKGNHNVGYTIIAVLIAFALYYYGGFFN